MRNPTRHEHERTGHQVVVRVSYVDRDLPVEDIDALVLHMMDVGRDEAVDLVLAQGVSVLGILAKHQVAKLWHTINRCSWRRPPPTVMGP